MNSLIILALIGFCKAIQDKISHHYYSSVFSYLNEKYWNKDKSWMNKLYFRHVPIVGEYITILLKTILVPLTDAWHLFGFLRGFLTVLLACTFIDKPDFYTGGWYVQIIFGLVIHDGVFWLLHDVLFNISYKRK